MIKTIAACAIALVLTSCRVATDADKISDDGGNQELTVSGVVAKDLCAVGVRCRGHKASSCLNGANKLVGLPDAMGAPYGKYRTVNDLIVGIENKEVFVNESALDLCRDALRRLSCQDEVVKSAFGNSTTNVDDIEFLLRVSTLCEQLIRTP